MPLTLDDNHATYQIRAYEPGRIQVNERIYNTSIIIAPEKLIDDWKPQNIQALHKEDLKIIVEWQPAILLIGTGSQLQFPELTIYGDLINNGIGVEVMDTRAACRTYAALSAENRNVVAALIIQ